MEKDDLRPFVLDAIRSDPSTQLNSVELAVGELAEDFSRSDALLLREILWDLLSQGILAPGINNSNLDLPFIHLTEYGQRCLKSESIVPHDPNSYLSRLKDQLARSLDETTELYLQESLQTFLSANLLASTVMLGVASERCIDLLADSLVESSEEAESSQLRKDLRRAGRSVKKRFDIVRDALLEMELPPRLDDALDIQLSGIFTLIRFSRNDAGHPTGRVIDRDTAHANLLLFPQYCKRVYELLDFLEAE